MPFKLKSAILPTGNTKKLASLFVIASKNTKGASQIKSSALKKLPVSIQEQINISVTNQHFTASIGQHISLLDSQSHIQFIVMGIGSIKDPAISARTAGSLIAKHCSQYNISSASILIDAEIWTAEESITHMVSGAADANYTFNAPYAMNEQAKKPLKSPCELTLLLESKPTVAQKALFNQARAIAKGIALAKHLGNLPPNFATPTYLGQVAQDLAKNYGFKVHVLEKKQIAALKMNSFLSVAKGSVEPPRFIVLEYKGGNPKDAPTVLVGKGITFDSGGISLKPGSGMDEMKYDMGGAASLLGTFKAIGEASPKINVIGLIAACENMPAGNASKPGDVVTTMAGLTVEILNTDAEGRLVLCDALTYAERYKPSAVVNMATLTGACVVALGHHHSGLFSNNEALAAELQSAGQTQRDTAWRMPLDIAYHEQLKSNFADLANIGGMPAGSVTAACFLSRFTESYPWAHLDIAGTAWKNGTSKGSTGRPVGLLSQFIFNRSVKK